MTSIIRWASNSLSSALDMNSAMLSGAIDVVVVEQPNGELQSSPFHVRFGKLQLLKAKGEIVHIRVNGVEAPLKMRLGSAGEAFFVERAREEEPARVEEVPASSEPEETVEATVEDKGEEVAAPSEGAVPPSEEGEAEEAEEVATSPPTRDLSAVLPKWYTQRMVSDEDSHSQDEEMLLAALEFREQQQARKFERAENESSSSTKTDDDQSSLSGVEDMSGVDEEDRREPASIEEQPTDNSWIWSYGSLPRRLHNAISSTVSSKSTPDAERPEVEAVLSDIITRVVEDAELTTEIPALGGEESPEPQPMGKSDQAPARTLLRMLWKRTMSARSTTTKDEGTAPEEDDEEQQRHDVALDDAEEHHPRVIEEEDVVVVVETAQQPRVDASSSSSSSSSSPQEEDVVVVVETAQQPRVEAASSPLEDKEPRGAAPPQYELVIRGDEVVDEQYFRSNSREIIADPRLRVRAGGAVELTLSEALPELVALAVFGSASTPAERVHDARATMASAQTTTTTTTTTTIIEGGRDEEDRENEVVPEETNAPEVTEGAPLEEGGFKLVRNILSELPSEQQSDIAAAVAAAAEDDQIELGSSDNLAALVALDQINPELSSTGNLAALISNTDLKAAFVQGMRKRSETNLAAENSSSTVVGFPLDAHGSSSSLEEPQKKERPRSASVGGGAPEQRGGLRLRSSSAGREAEATSFSIPEKKKKKNTTTTAAAAAAETSPSDATEGVAARPSPRDAPAPAHHRRRSSSRGEKGRKFFPYRKTLRPSARQIASLSLKRGANSVEFFVRKAKGEQVVSATVYRWPRSSKCVFAEVDGVIASGGVAPLQLLARRLGSNSKQQHSGVAELFTTVARNGYRIIYVTTRAIGVASSTRGALEQLWEGDVGLPRAPVLLAPGSLLDSAYYSGDFDARRFKTAALTNILALFPGRNPLWAAVARGRDDVSPYLDAGVPRGRVFRIYLDGDPQRPPVLGGFDSTGAVVSSYKRLNSLVHQTFPAFQDDDFSGRESATEYLRPLRDTHDDRFNDLNFWKLPPPKLLEKPLDLPAPAPAPLSPVDSPRDASPPGISDPPDSRKLSTISAAISTLKAAAVEVASPVVAKVAPFANNSNNNNNKFDDTTSAAAAASTSSSTSSTSIATTTTTSSRGGGLSTVLERHSI
ncbi:hypothetical protein CTAYLR_005044 [Chrysophaeum taylorii]|uniref:LNS2/PITP domain-containing protein n=1 Tax=Chrysophaeum taylorii TaxID=2483200 RepID=A0AAD7U9X3_9STRA|nr:hypothetical protein CTAYLR_005044 [Chrysophaeum taylorii]